MVYKVITKNRCCLRYKVIWPYKWYHRTQSVPVLCVEDGVCNKEHPWVWAFDNDKLIYDIFPQHFFTADQGKPIIFGSLCSGRGREIFLLSHFSYVLRGFRTFSPCCVSRWNIMLRGGGAYLIFKVQEGRTTFKFSMSCRGWPSLIFDIVIRSCFFNIQCPLL